jgi:threonine dehydrogenase-like Zn-dependent dehydrogenase
VVDVRRAGICGTDVELFTGQLAYFAQGKIGFPIRPGHEWCGVVTALGDGVDPGWLGARVTGDTMLGCGHCPRCAAGRGHVCADRREVGIMGWPGGSSASASRACRARSTAATGAGTKIHVDPCA